MELDESAGAYAGRIFVLIAGRDWATVERFGSRLEQVLRELPRSAQADRSRPKPHPNSCKFKSFKDEENIFRQPIEIESIGFFAYQSDFPQFRNPSKEIVRYPDYQSEAEFLY